MKEFKSLDKREIYEVESDILKKWNGVEGIYKKTLEAHKHLLMVIQAYII